MNKRDKTVFLLRNSDASQDMSLESQRDECERFARDRKLVVLRQLGGHQPDVFRDGAFVDDSISGARTEKRRGFQALMRACQSSASTVRYVVCYDISRFGRFDQDEAGHHRHLLKQAGVEILFVAEGFTGDDSDDLVRGVKQWQSRKYLQDLSRVTQRGLIQLAEQGYWFGGVPPFGFDLRYEMASGESLSIVRFESDGTKTVLDPDGNAIRRLPRGEQMLRAASDRARLCLSSSERVELVTEIFQLRIAGSGYKKIAETLNRRHIPAPRDGKWSERHKAGWSHGTVRNVLENPAYLGRLVYNRTSFSAFHQIRNGKDGPRSVVAPNVRESRILRIPQQDWIVADVSHPAIISEELWDRAQSVRRDTRKPHARGATADYVFSGLVDCTACDHRFQGHTTTKGKRRQDGSKVCTRCYICGGYHSKGSAICPQRWTVREDVLWRVVVGKIAKQFDWLVRSQDFASAVQRRADEIIRRPSADAPAADSLRQQRDKIDATLQALVENLDPLNLQLINNKFTELREKREAIDAKIDQLKSCDSPPRATVTAEMREAARSVRSVFAAIETASPGLKRRFLREFVERIELDPRKKAGVAWFWQLPTSVLDSLRLSVSRIEGNQPASKVSRFTQTSAGRLPALA